jgi:hypothetical protein
MYPYKFPFFRRSTCCPIETLKKFVSIGLITGGFGYGDKMELHPVLKFAGCEVIDNRLQQGDFFYNDLCVNKYLNNVFKSILQLPNSEIARLSKIGKITSVKRVPPKPRPKAEGNLPRLDMIYYADACESVTDLFNTRVCLYRTRYDKYYELLSYTDTNGYIAFVGGLMPEQAVPKGMTTNARNDYLLYNNISKLAVEPRKYKVETYGELEACYLAKSGMMFLVYLSCIISFPIASPDITYIYPKTQENLSALLSKMLVPVPLLWGAFHRPVASNIIAKVV